MEKIRNAVSKFVSGVNYIGLAVCFVMVFVVSIDVILRKVSGQRLSISGSNEFSSYFLIVMVMLAIPVLQIKKGHVMVDMFVNMMPAKVRCIWVGIVLAIETVIVLAFAYGSYMYMLALMENGRATDILDLPWWPFAAVCIFGFVEFAVLLAIDTIQSFLDVKKVGKA